MTNVIFTTILKGVAVYFLALFLARLIGKKLISQMTFLDFVIAVSMGAIIASSLIDEDYPTTSEVTALILFAILGMIISYINLKSIKIRKLITSEPIVLIENGIILDNILKKSRLTINELMMKLREKDIFNLQDIEYAILERDGQVTVLVKSEKKPVTAEDMNIKVKSSGLMKDIIIDGNIIEKNLILAKVDKNWLEAQLRKNNIDEISEVFYAGIDNDKKLNISKKSMKKLNNKNFGLE